MLVLAATAIVGMIGYVITWLVPRIIGVEAYAPFAVFWAAVFLVATTLSGIQQELARGTREPSGPRPTGTASTAVRFSVGAAVITGIAVVATAPLWAGPTFGDGAWSLVWPLAVGAVAYVFVAALTGTLYALQEWTGVFWIVLSEGVFRLLLVATTLIWTHSVVSLAWAVVLPFALTLGVVAPFALRRLRRRTALDVGLGGLYWNVARTMTAAASTGLLISGFPVVLSITSHDADATLLGTVILTATLTRAPIVVVGMALQSFFIVLFREHAGRAGRILAACLGVLLVLGALLSLLAWLFGEPVFEWLFPADGGPDASLIAALAGSSALVGALCLTGPAVLARGHHLLYALGWLGAAIATVSLLLLPLPFIERTVLALFVGPAIGIIVHLVSLVGRRTEALTDVDTAPTLPL